MKKFLSIAALFLLLSPTSFAGVKKGKGEVKMSNQSIDRFIEYIRGKKSQKPLAFILSDDGLWSTWWYCEHGSCRSGNYEPTIKECERATGTDCGLFARRYTILWKNGINPGKGKESTIRMKWSDDQIRAKLSELGFVDDGSSLNFSNNENLSKDYPNTLFFPDDEKIKNWRESSEYGEGTIWPFVVWSEVRKNQSSDIYSYQWQASKTLNQAVEASTKGCDARLKKRKKEFKNDQICIVQYINGLETTNEEKIKFAEKFYGKKVSNKFFEKNNWILDEKDTTNKIISKKYNLEEKKSIAISWEGYDSLIAGLVNFNEIDYKGTLNLSLPNGDGECNGSYSLQKDGKGTWQIGCTNNMGAAGTLKWDKISGVIGNGRDHNDKKVKFTVAGNS